MSDDAKPLLSSLDLFILSGIGGFLVYWLLVRRKPKATEIVEIKKLAPPVLMRSDTYDPSFINKMKKTGRNVVVFYGSQTGTAEEFAGRLSRECQRYGMKGMAADPEEYSMDDLAKLKEIPNSIAIFVMATYGEGDPTDNAHEFKEWLQSDQDVAELRYAVFGCGNKTYEHYNSMGKLVDKRLAEMGATRIFELGLGDDDANIEEDFVTWKERFWPAVCSHFGISPSDLDVSMRQYTLTVHDESLPKEKAFVGEPARLGSFKTQRPPYDAKNPFLAPVSVNRELFKNTDRSCLHIELDITDSKIRYESGDHVAVYPVNDAILVNAIGERLGVDLDQVISLVNIDEEASKKNPFPSPCTYRTALLHYLDIISPPHTHILKEMAEYCSDPEDKQFLDRLVSSSDDGKKLYNEWILESQRHILAVLEDVKSLKPPIDHLCELLPRLQARYYSISSSSRMYPNSIHITAVVVHYKTSTGREMNGVATSWLKLKTPTETMRPTVPIYVRKSQFRLPFRPATPIIMVGPGSGLAPFRGFIQQRHLDKQDGKPVGDTILYYGCRHKDQDFLYEEELQTNLQSGGLTTMHVAFSRDQQQKVYVQDLMRQNKQEIWQVLESGGHVYVCGDAKNMARDVHKCLNDVIVECGGKSEAEAADYVKKLQQKGRYAQDVWS